MCCRYLGDLGELWDEWADAWAGRTYEVQWISSEHGVSRLYAKYTVQLADGSAVVQGVLSGL